MARRKRNTNITKKEVRDGKDSASAGVAESSIATNRDNQKSPFLENFGLTIISPEATPNTSEYKRGRPKKILLLKSAEKTDKPIEKRCTRLSHPVQDMNKLPEKNSPKKKRSGVKYFPVISASFENVTFTLPESDQAKANLRKSKSVSPSKKQNFMPSSSKLLDLSFIPDNEMFGQEMKDCPKIVDLSLSPNEPSKSRVELRKSKSISPTKKQKALDIPLISDEMFNQGLKDSQDKYNNMSLSSLEYIIECEIIQKESSEEAIKSDKMLEESPLIEAVTTGGKLQKSRKTIKQELLKNCKTLDSNSSILSTATLNRTKTSETTKDSGTEEQEVNKSKRKRIKRKPNDNTEMTVVPSESVIPIPIVVLNRTINLGEKIMKLNIDKCDMAAFLSKSTDVQNETKKYNMIDAQALQKHSIKRNDNSIIPTFPTAKTTIPRDATVVPYETSIETVASVTVAETEKEQESKKRPSRHKQPNHYSVILTSATNETYIPEKIMKLNIDKYDMAAFLSKSTDVQNETKKYNMIDAQALQKHSIKCNDNSIIPTFPTAKTTIPRDATVVPYETSIETVASATVAETEEEQESKKRPSRRKQPNHYSVILTSTTNETYIPEKIMKLNIDKYDMAAFLSKSTDVQNETKKYNMIDAQALQKHSIKRNDKSIIPTFPTAKTTIPRDATVVPYETSIETVASATVAETEEEQESKKRPSRCKQPNHYSVILTSTTNETSIPRDTTLVPCETSIEIAESATVAETEEEQESKKRQCKRKQRNHDSVILTSITNETTIPRDATLVPCETSIETVASAIVAETEKEQESKKRPSKRKQRDHNSVILTSTTNETTILRDATIVPCKTSIETVVSATDVVLSDGTKEQQPKRRQSKRKQRDSDPMIPTSGTFPNEKKIIPSDAAVILSETTIEAVASAEAAILSETAKEREAKIHQRREKKDVDFVFPMPTVVPNALFIIPSDTMKDSRAEVRESKKHNRDHDTTRVASSETPVVVQTKTVTKSRADVKQTKKHQRKDKKHDTAEVSSARNTIERGLTKPHSNSSAPIAANILVTDQKNIFLPIENINKKSHRSDDILHKKTKTPYVDPNATAVTNVSKKTDKGRMKKNHIDTAALSTVPESEIDNNVTQRELKSIIRNKTSKTREELLKIFNAIENSYAEDERKPFLEMHADTIDWEENCADAWEANPFIPCGREWTAVRKPQLNERDGNPFRKAPLEAFQSC